MADIRCKQCGALLGKEADVRHIEIKCSRCKTYNIVGQDSAGSYHYNVQKLDNNKNVSDNVEVRD